MGFLSMASRMIRGGARAAAGTVGKALLRQVPGIGLGMAAMDVIGSFSGPSAPAGMPAMPQLPMLPMAASPMMMAASAPGVPAAFATQAATRGSRVMPPLTMDMIQSLTAAGLFIGFKDLRTYHRSPSKRHVVVHPPGGGTFALEKKLARSWGLWAPSAKPPISAGDWNSIKRANSVIKKIRGMNSDIKKVANFGMKSQPRLQVLEAPGRKVIGRKA